MDTIKRIGLERLGLVVSPEGPQTPEVVGALVAELAHVGVKVTNPEKVTDNLVGGYKELVAHIRRMRGEKRTYSPLFTGFPERLPSVDHGYLRFLLAAARLADSDQSDEALREALDFTAIGWWPASSVPQDVDQTLLDRARQEVLPGDSRIQWMPVRVVTETELDEALKQYTRDCFAGAASLREDVRNDLEVLVAQYGTSHIDVGTVRFRETRTLLLKLIWQGNRKALATTGATPDDLLRLFADLTGGDVSLGEKVTYPKLSRADRRVVVNTLEASTRLGDLFRRRDLWLAIDRGLHVGEFKAPKLQEALGRLRATRHDRSSLGSRFEALLGTDLPSAVELLTREAPGVLGRQLRRLMALAATREEQETVLKAIETVGTEIPMRVLLAARSQVADNGATYPRVVFTKTGKALRIENGPGHLAVDGKFRDEVLETIDRAITGIVSEKGTWNDEKVYVDPQLDSVLLPDQLRTTAQGLVQVERGTRLPLGEAKVLRLFVHWKESEQTTDLDLSCVTLTEEFQMADYVSWTNLGNGTMTHSGDITSAPAGAEEFIDIDIAKAKAKAKERGWRYLVPSILRYAGETFDALDEANTGWMLRDKPSSDRRTFDPATVVNAFELTGSQRTSVPFLVDLETDEILYVDVYLAGAGAATVERDGTSISSLVSAAAARRNIKPTVASLAMHHLLGRGGELVDDRSEATITFGLTDDDTYNALRPERMLAELL